MFRFVSQKVKYRVYLGPAQTGAGGRWANFINGGNCNVNIEDAKILRKNPMFGIEFYEVNAFDQKYKCPDKDCDYVGTFPQMKGHVGKKHTGQFSFKQEELEKV